MHAILEEGQAPDTSYLDVMPRLEFLSKRCNQLTKENADLQENCDRLTTENQKLKRTMMRKFVENFTIYVIQ